MNSTAPSDRSLSTPDLCAELKITRNVLTRLRDEHHGDFPEPTRIGSVLIWQGSAVSALRAILVKEKKSKGVKS